MKPESAKFIEQANILLGRAEIMLTVNLNEDAARTAYLSCHHAALAYIFERTGNSSKSHKGAQIEFLRLTKIDSRADVELRRFLSKSYEFKSVADYFTGQNGITSPQEAAAAVSTARRFIDHFGQLV